MICPHCGYTATNKRGEHGPLFQGGQKPLVLSRNRIGADGYAYRDWTTVIGCPACRKVFISGIETEEH